MMKSRKRAIRRFYDYVVGKREKKISPREKFILSNGGIFDPDLDFHNEKLERIHRKEMINSLRNEEDF